MCIAHTLFAANTNYWHITGHVTLKKPKRVPRFCNLILIRIKPEHPLRRLPPHISCFLYLYKSSSDIPTITTQCKTAWHWLTCDTVISNRRRRALVAGGHCTAKDLASFLSEATLMKDFNHPNVLSLLGLVINYNKPHVVLPFMQHGDLKSYIKAPSRVNRHVNNKNNIL